MDKRDKILLQKIFNEIVIIENFIVGYDYDKFVNDEKTKRAVCMTMINIGEKVKLLSNELKSNNPNINWKEMAGIRDVTAHRYDNLNMDYVWETASESIPIIKNNSN